MLHNFRQFICMHIWEYDFDISHDEIRECRKCGKIHKVKSSHKGFNLHKFILNLKNK